MTCPRCGNESSGSVMSRFNTQQICFGCEEIERAHRKYLEAATAELAAVQRGDYNFPGIGLPADLARTAVRKGTYLREPDGACFVYHSPETYVDAAAAFRSGAAFAEKMVGRTEFQPVHGFGELAVLERDYGPLQPGEYVEVA